MKKILTLAIVMIALTIVSCKKEKSTNENVNPPVAIDSIPLPQLHTLYMRDITDASAKCVCKIDDWDMADIIEYGCCWSTSHYPTINDNHRYTSAIISGEYRVPLTDLTPGTTYYVRAYGKNAEGVGYGNEISFVAENEEPHPNPWSPEPVDGHIPSSVLPDAIADEIGQYMNIYSGENPMVMDSVFNASPYVLIHTNFVEATDSVYHDFRFQFIKKDNNKVDLIVWQWNNEIEAYTPEDVRDVYMLGSGNNFTAYYLKEDYSEGGYVRLAAIFSGTWDEANNAVNDFKVATIVVKTFENPDYTPENSYGIFGDADGVSEYFSLINPNPDPSWWSPEPEDGHIPSSVLPDELANEISQYVNFYQGVYPPEFDCQFVSHPHTLFYSTIDEPLNTVQNDRYVAFVRNGDKVDFYGKQWNDEINAYYEEAYRQLNIIGEGNDFTIYYITDGYPNGMYAKQSTIFSGTWDAANNAINDFKVVVILLETSGNPNLAPVNTYRVCGDGDGFSEYNPWLMKSPVSSTKMSDEDLFKAFRVR